MDCQLDNQLEYIGLEGSASSTYESPSPPTQLNSGVAQESGHGHHELVSPFSNAQYPDPPNPREAMQQGGNALLRGDFQEGGPIYTFSSDALLPSLEELFSDPEGRWEIPSRADPLFRNASLRASDMQSTDTRHHASGADGGWRRSCAASSMSLAAENEAADTILITSQVWTGPEASCQLMGASTASHANTFPMSDNALHHTGQGTLKAHAASHTEVNGSQVVPAKRSGFSRGDMRSAWSGPATAPLDSQTIEGGTNNPPRATSQAHNLESRYRSVPETPLEDQTTHRAKRSRPLKLVRAASGAAAMEVDSPEHDDYAIDPETGRQLQFGPAMAKRKLQANVPSVATLFKDMASPRRSLVDRWKANPNGPPPPVRARLGGARAEEVGSGLGRSSSMNKKWPNKEVQPVVSLKRSQSLGTSEEASSSESPLQLPQVSTQEMPHGVQHGNGGLTLPDSKRPRITGGVESDQTASGQPPQLLDTEMGWPQPESLQGGLATMQSPAASSDTRGRGEGSGSRRPTTQGFGGIARGVIQAAAATANSGRPPVRSLEEILQERSRSKPIVYKGVSRCPWSVTWDAHVTPGDGEDATFLGSFPTSDTAARAHDVAALHLGGSSAATNFSADEYLADLEDMKEVSITDFILAMQRYGAFGQDRQSKYRGVHRHSQTEWESRYPEDLDHETASR